MVVDSDGVDSSGQTVVNEYDPNVREALQDIFLSTRGTIQRPPYSSPTDSVDQSAIDADEQKRSEEDNEAFLAFIQ
jgi:hypothetical protein